MSVTQNATVCFNKLEKYHWQVVQYFCSILSHYMTSMIRATGQYNQIKLMKSVRSNYVECFNCKTND